MVAVKKLTASEELVEYYDLSKLIGATGNTAIDNPEWCNVSDYLLSETSPLSAADKYGYTLWAAGEHSSRFRESILTSSISSYYDATLYEYALQVAPKDAIERIVFPGLRDNPLFRTLEESQIDNLLKSLSSNDAISYQEASTILEKFFPHKLERFLELATLEKAFNFVASQLGVTKNPFQARGNTREFLIEWASKNILKLEEPMPEAWVIKMLQVNEKYFPAGEGK